MTDDLKFGPLVYEEENEKKLKNKVFVMFFK